MTNNQIVNIDYIPIVRQVGNSVAVERLHISKPAELLATLKIMVENPNHTIYDIQNQMTRHFREPERKYLSFLSPYSYYSAWVEGVSFPQIYTYDEYKQLTKDTQEEVLKSNESTLNFYRKEYGEELAQQKLSEFIQKETQRKNTTINSVFAILTRITTKKLSVNARINLTSKCIQKSTLVYEHLNTR